MDIQSPKSEPMFVRSSFLVGRGKPHIAHNILLRANSFGGPSALLVHEFKVRCGSVLRGSWVNKSSISSLPKVAPKESCKKGSADSEQIHVGSRDGADERGWVPLQKDKHRGPTHHEHTIACRGALVGDIYI